MADAKKARSSSQVEMKKELIQLNLNGKTHQVAVYPNRLLIEVLREELGLTGTKRGCDDSSCGCCAVLVDGQPMLSCAMLAVSYEDHAITTIEGLTVSAQLDPLQQGFIDEGGAQCGFCTPGIILATRALLDRNPDPTLDEIRDALSGNLCRCTGYTQSYESIRKAIALERERRGAAVGR